MNAPGGLLRRVPALNPVMVKELRQFVRSRVMLAALMLLLSVLLVTITVFALSTSVERVLTGDGDLDGGRRLFTILLPILNAVCVLCVPGYCAMRLTSERSAAKPTMSPRPLSSHRTFATTRATWHC